MQTYKVSRSIGQGRLSIGNCTRAKPVISAAVSQQDKLYTQQEHIAGMNCNQKFYELIHMYARNT